MQHQLQPSRNSWRQYVSLPGVASLSFGAWLYLCATSCDAVAKRLETARPVAKLSDAARLGSLPLFVALKGRAESRNPKKCELCDQDAVLHEICEEDILVTKGPTGALERKPFEVRHEWTERQWFLSDDSGTSVRVGRAKEAAASELRDAVEVRQDYTERRDGGAAPLTSLHQVITGARAQGRRRTETYLPVGAVVTVVGQLVAAAIPSPDLPGVSLEVVPAPGLPFIISKRSLQELVWGMAARSASFRTAAHVFGGVGVALILRKLLRTLWVRYRERQARRTALQMAARGSRAAAGTSAAAAAAEEDSSGLSESAGVCVVCLSAPSSMVFVSCGHLCCCPGCCRTLNKCPVCRTSSMCIRVYRP